MPTATHRFATPEPITLRLRNHAGSVEILASETDETVVEVTGHPDEPATVELSADSRTLVVEPERGRRIHRHRLDMVVRLPAGSLVHAHTAAASVEVRGRIAEFDAATASGRVSAEEVAGRAEVSTASGSVRFGRVGGSASFQSASGSLEVEHVGQACTARTASGSVQIGLADGDVAATTVSGTVAVREVHRGIVDVSSTSGRVDVGVRRGTLVWLDVSSVAGRTRSDLAPEDGAGGGAGSTLSLRAHSVSGAVTVSPTGAAPIAL
ncbi:MAG: DUF4097 family beta strand repeat-containing protein [Acidimicrobiales bacterium]|nr:DUF4097 family beta strand repeat-containing protein [Acidimicrobiales bacterium]